MSFTRFKEIVDAYGGNPNKWPEAWQSLYAQYAHTAEGRVALAEAERIDLFLGAYAGDETVPPALAAAIYALPGAGVAANPPNQARIIRIFGMSCAVLMLCGFFAGLEAGYDGAAQSGGLDQITAVIFGIPGMKEIQ